MTIVHIDLQFMEFRTNRNSADQSEIVTRQQSAIATATGSETWNVSAQADKADGIDAMKAASEQRDAQRDGYGKVEELAGKAAGCEGMEKEGAQSKEQQ